MKRLARGVALIAAAAVVALGTPSYAAECREVQFADQARVGEADLVLNGLGIRKATMLKVKVYVAGLYLAQKASDPAAILASDGDWRLVLRFMRDVEGADIRDAFTEGYGNAVGEEKAEALRPRIDALNALVPDLKEGDRLTFVHRAGKGVAVEVNEAVKGEVDGGDFAAATLGIWLGPEPPNESLKEGLLGGECD